MRPNIRVEIQNNLVEKMEVEENEEGEISDNDEKTASDKQLVEFAPDEALEVCKPFKSLVFTLFHSFYCVIAPFLTLIDVYYLFFDMDNVSVNLPLFLAKTVLFFVVSVQFDS